MNKQIVIASLLGAAAAQPAVVPIVCEDAFTKMADKAKLTLDAKKTALATEKTALAASATTENTAYTTAKGRYDTQNTLMIPFKTALTNASNSHKAKADASLAAQTQITALEAVITAKIATKTAADAAVTAQNAKISAQKLIIADLAKQVELHTAEKVIVDKALVDADTDLTAKKKVETDAKAAKTALETARAAASGSATKKAAAVSAASTANGAYNTAVSEEATALAAYKTAKSNFDRDTRKKSDYLAGCKGGSDDCTGQTNDPVRAMYDAAVSSLSTTTGVNTSTKSTWDGKVTAVATKQDLKNQADLLVEVWTARDTTMGGLITGAGNAVTTATAGVTGATSAKGTATTNVSTITTQLAQATTDKGRGDALLTKLNTALTPLTDAVTVAKAMQKIETDKKDVQVAAKATADLNLADFATLKSMAQETVTRAQKKLTFYKDLMDTAKKSKDAVDGLVTKNANAITTNATALTDNAASIKAAIATCKGIGYEKAQEAMKALLAKNKAEAANYATVKTAYDLKTAWPTTGTAGADCSYPIVAKDAAQTPRPKCNDGLCCGAAQKFMRDGTKVAVETCQKPDTRTYTFLPPLAKNAQAEPASQTWRFQCISGAKQLVASTAAALVATYMMA